MFQGLRRRLRAAILAPRRPDDEVLAGGPRPLHLLVHAEGRRGATAALLPLPGRQTDRRELQVFPGRCIISYLYIFDERVSRFEQLRSRVFGTRIVAAAKKNSLDRLFNRAWVFLKRNGTLEIRFRKTEPLYLTTTTLRTFIVLRTGDVLTCMSMFVLFLRCVFVLISRLLFIREHVCVCYYYTFRRKSVCFCSAVTVHAGDLSLKVRKCCKSARLRFPRALLIRKWVLFFLGRGIWNRVLLLIRLLFRQPLFRGKQNRSHLSSPSAVHC